MDTPETCARRFRFVSVAVFLTIITAANWLSFHPVAAQETAGGAVTTGTLRITSREIGTGTLLTGACYRLNYPTATYLGCDALDGLDGITTIEAEPGTGDLFTNNPPPDHFYGPPIEGITIVAGATETVTFRHQPGGLDIRIRAFDPAGDPAPGACYFMATNNGGTPGEQRSATICDWQDGRNDGATRLNGVSSQPNPSVLIVMAFAPPGYRTPSPQAATIADGVDERVYFHLSKLALSPSCTIGPTSGKVGTTIKVNCKGFPDFQAVAVKWDGRSSASVVAFSNDEGRFTAFLTVPAATAGAHRVVVASDTHRAPTKSFTVLSSLSVSPESGLGGSTARATIRGFASGETVTIRVQGRRTVLATITASATGSGSALFTIPDGESASLVVRADGNAGNAATDGFQRTGPSPAADLERQAPTEAPEPTATPSSTPQPEATATETATAEATATPSEEPPSSTPGPEATASPTSSPEASPSPTEASADSPSAIPSPAGTG